MGNQFSVSGGMGFIMSQCQKANDVTYKDQWAENKNKSKPLMNMLTFNTKNKGVSAMTLEYRFNPDGSLRTSSWLKNRTKSKPLGDGERMLTHECSDAGVSSQTCFSGHDHEALWDEAPNSWNFSSPRWLLSGQNPKAIFRWTYPKIHLSQNACTPAESAMPRSTFSTASLENGCRYFR